MGFFASGVFGPGSSPHTQLGSYRTVLFNLGGQQTSLGVEDRGGVVLGRSLLSVELSSLQPGTEAKSRATQGGFAMQLCSTA